MPPMKTFIMPLMMIGAMAPHLDARSWSWVILCVLLATWVGQVITDKIENSEWRKQLAKDADAASRRGEEQDPQKKEAGSKKKKK